MAPLFWIILLIILGILLFVAELILLPGITVAAVLSFCSLCGAVAWTFSSYGVLYGFVSLGVVVAIIGVLTALLLRSRTWRKVALNTELKGTIDSPIAELCALGSKGKALTRIAPIGKVEIDSQVFEAKVLRGFIDEGSDIEVVGYDNQNVIIKRS